MNVFQIVGEIFLDDKAHAGLDKVEKKSKTTEAKMRAALGGVGNVLAGVGKAAMGAALVVGAAAGAAAVGIFKLSTEAAKNADEINTLAAKYGVTATQLQEFSYAAKFVDVSVETMGNSMAKLTKTMGNAENGNKAANKAFADLGISLKDSEGNTRDSLDVWTEAIDKLGGVANETDRNILSQQLFGRSAQELNPLIAAGGDALKKYADEAHNVGAVMDDVSLNKLQVLNDAFDSAKSTFDGLKNTIGAAAAPAITGLAGMFQNLTGAVQNAISTGDWGQIGTVIADGLQTAATEVSNLLPQILQVVTTVIPALVTAIAEAVPVVIPALVEAVLKLVDALVNVIVENGPTLITTAINAISTLVMGLLDALPLILDAALQMILALADGIADNLPKLIPAAVDCVLKLVQTLVDNLPKLIDAALKIILALVDGVIAAIPKLMEAAPKIIVSLVNGIVQAIPKLLDAALQIILALIKFIPTYIPMLIQATPQIITAIVTGLISAVGAVWEFVPKMFKELINAFGSIDWGKLGKNIIDGIAKGISSSASAILDAAKKAAQNALNAVKKLLGISSPSRVFEDEVGFNVGAGLAEGIDGSKKLVSKAIGGMRDQLTMGPVDLGTMNFGAVTAATKGLTGNTGTVTNSAAASGRIGAQTDQQRPIIFNFNGPVVGGKEGERELARIINKIIYGQESDILRSEA